jgi:hypothetical protein
MAAPRQDTRDAGRLLRRSHNVGPKTLIQDQDSHGFSYSQRQRYGDKSEQLNGRKSGTMINGYPVNPGGISFISTVALAQLLIGSKTKF